MLKNLGSFELLQANEKHVLCMRHNLVTFLSPIRNKSPTNRRILLTPTYFSNVFSKFSEVHDARLGKLSRQHIFTSLSAKVLIPRQIAKLFSQTAFLASLFCQNCIELWKWFLGTLCFICSIVFIQLFNYSSMPNKRTSQINVPMGILSKINKRTKPKKRTNTMGTLSKIYKCTKKA